MPALRVILFPTDGSPCAEGARRLAETLAERCGADLHELTVEPGPPDRLGFDFPGPTVSDGEFAADLNLPTSESPQPRRIVRATRFGPPGPGVVKYAADVGAEVIVMGMHGRAGLERLAMGSTSEYVLRRSACPVLLARIDRAPTLGLGLVLVPFDFSEPAKHALAAGRAVAKAAGAALDVLHVIETANVRGSSDPFAAPAGNEARRDRAEQALREHAGGTEADGPLARLTVRVGNAVEEILACARDEGAGLIVVGSHGRRGVERLLLGSVAEEVARRAPCPVLVVKAREAPASRAQAVAEGAASGPPSHAVPEHLVELEEAAARSATLGSCALGLPAPPPVV